MFHWSLNYWANVSLKTKNIISVASTTKALNALLAFMYDWWDPMESLMSIEDIERILCVLTASTYLRRFKKPDRYFFYPFSIDLDISLFVVFYLTNLKLVLFSCKGERDCFHTLKTLMFCVLKSSPISNLQTEDLLKFRLKFDKALWASIGLTYCQSSERVVHFDSKKSFDKKISFLSRCQHRLQR